MIIRITSALEAQGVISLVPEPKEERMQTFGKTFGAANDARAKQNLKREVDAAALLALLLKTMPTATYEKLYELMEKREKMGPMTFDARFNLDKALEMREVK